jgi:hypothetical protein
MRHLLTGWLVLACACGGQTRSYDVVVDNEKLCRMFDPAPDNCALTNGAALQMTITIEDRSSKRAIIYGRSDTNAERVYVADFPRTGRYEVLEQKDDANATSGCVTSSRTTVVLDVDDNGLTGGEEVRIEENGKCNTFNQRRVTRRLRDWKGSRVAGEKGNNPFTR